MIEVARLALPHSARRSTRVVSTGILLHDLAAVTIMRSLESVERSLALVIVIVLIGLTILHLMTDVNTYLISSALLFGSVIVFSGFQLTKLDSNRLAPLAAVIGIPAGIYGVWLVSKGVSPFENTLLGIVVILWVFVVSGSDKIDNIRSEYYSSNK